MRTKLTKIVLAATFALALAFTFSCSDDKEEGGGNDIGPCSDGTVRINDQIWQRCNSTVVPSTGTHRCYNDDPSNCDKYGRLYDWAAAMALPSSCNSSTCASQISAKHQGICPSGWHIPSGGEWADLVYYAGGPSTAGTKLKARSGWAQNGNGTDNFGFAALPGGYYSGSFDFLGIFGEWWSTDDLGEYARRFWMQASAENAQTETNYRKNAALLSVRCLQN